MELKQLIDSTLELFGVSNVSQLGKAVFDACNNPDKLHAFKKVVNGDLQTDWIQKIYQYYLADRKEKKQDFTPSSVAEFMGMLAGKSEQIIDMCTGSGALIIQKWKNEPETLFTAIETDRNVIPFLLFNLVLRNIKCIVYQIDVLTGEDCVDAWEVKKGEEFGRVVNIKSTI